MTGRGGKPVAVVLVGALRTEDDVHPASIVHAALVEVDVGQDPKRLGGTHAPGDDLQMDDVDGSAASGDAIRAVTADARAAVGGVDVRRDPAHRRVDDGRELREVRAPAGDRRDRGKQRPQQ
jgi:hypothetical protein